MEERIKYLFRQYLQNTCSREELEEFFMYVHQSKNDEALRDLVRKVYDAIRQTSSSPTYVDESGNLVLTEPGWLSPPVAEKKIGKKRIAMSIVIVACVIATAAIVWLTNRAFHHNTQIATRPPLTKKFTERSEYKYLLLPDSTQVWLNAGSSLEFPGHFGETKREVFLSGEAYFDVKHADKTLFIIHTGKVSTTVLGTAFNIKAYPGHENIIVSVSRGRVKISRDDEQLAVLTIGQQIKVSSRDKHIAEKNIPVTEVAAWQQGNMVYEDENLKDILADLERVYNVNIHVNDASILNLKVSTSFRREIGIEQALEILCKLTDRELKQADGLYTIQ